MIFFEWDEAKAQSNLHKHGVDFDDAIEAFYDPYAFTELERIENGEQRWQTTGSINGALMVLVAHTTEEEEPDEIIRIISARLAARKERERYGENRQKSMG